MKEARGVPTAKVPHLRQFWALIGKELELEYAARLRINALLPFALLVLLLFSFAVGPQPALLTRLAPGFLWLALLLSSVLSLAESQAAEAAHGAQEGLMMMGVPQGVVYLAKASANALFLTLLGALLLPVCIGLYGGTVVSHPLVVVAILGLGAMAISAPGTLVAALTADAPNKDVLLPLLLFPILVPGLLGAVRATSLTMLGDPLDELLGWTVLLSLFNGLYWPLCTVLFERVMEAR